MRPKVEDVPLTDETELACLIPMQQAAKLAGVSRRTLMRYHGKKIRTISPGRKGMHLGDALMIPKKEQLDGMTLGDVRKKRP